MRIARIIAAVAVIALLVFLVYYEEIPHATQVSMTGPRPQPSFGSFHPVTFHISRSAKVTIVFIGSEACPYCDAESWVIYYALLDYGSWSSIQYVHSYNGDVFPNTPGIDLMNSTYTSPTVVFHGIELYNETWQRISYLNASMNSTFERYDPQESLPFIIVNGEYVEIGSSYSPSYLSNMAADQVMQELSTGKGKAASVIMQQASYVDSMISYLMA
ncbi:hypothetical protein DMB44_09145 [Thermoplasma sp. Kam2015]|uniref:DUF929 family protein n=1 Tax=Thermoplasma sp. Kam2015 TaxID=2094122 RepID=UPI000D9BAB87|nr:DUF929 family protein [Thermoplasma sp. Kam2015]PYB67452.1 hypothetical protein DMB44_09145 [Thermoplasma sp. Kam2015]